MNQTCDKLARQIDDLLPRGSKGGWWALAGFSFQAAVYLESFFRGVHAGTVEPGQLAQMERLSDIFAPDDEYFRLIQVKRTLWPEGLRSALREAYGIASRCDPRLLESIRFQVVCLKRATTKNPADIPRTEVKGADDPDLWQRTLAQFDPIEPVVEAPDPLDRLHYLLWECGLRDTHGFLELCRGKLLGAFYDPTAGNIEGLARELASLFRQRQHADAVQHAKSLGPLLFRDDLAEADKAKDDRTVIVARRPRYDDLRRGRFRRRDQIFANLVACFDAWWTHVANHSDAEHLPIFWIDGRSGDGKSVLMLQLAQHLLARTDPPALVGDLSPDEVPDWIAVQAKAENIRGASPQRPILALVDDMHSANDLEEWDQRLREATQDHVPRVALLACGPTPEREVFDRICRPRVKIDPFTIPKLSDEEVDKTIAWFRTRTGREPPHGIASADNRPLVVLLFELAQGQSLGDFQKNFRQRLESQGPQLVVVARQILALNALELPAPTQILDTLTSAAMDFFNKLCVKSQLHFEHVAPTPLKPFAGYRLAHPQIGWWLYQEWAPDYASLATAWARDVAAVLTRCSSEVGGDNFTVEALWRFGNTGRLAEAHGHASTGSTNEALRELYRKCTGDFRVRTLPRWLDYLYHRSDLTLNPDPVQLAFDLCSDATTFANVHPSVAGWLWRLSETSRFAKRTEEMRRHAQSLLSRDPPTPGTAQSLVLIVSMVTDRAEAERFARHWLERFGRTADAYQLLATLVANRAQDEKVAEEAVTWIKNNPKHDKAYQLLDALVANRAQDEKVAEEAVAWIKNNPKHDKAYQLLATLVANRAQDGKVSEEAVTWIKNNPQHDKAYQLLATLVANRAQDEKVAEEAVTWIKNNPIHDRAYWLLNALVANRAQDGKVAEEAVTWVRNNPKHDKAYQLLATLVANRAQDEKVAEEAVTWIKNNPKHDKAYQLLATLVANRPQDEKVAEDALNWIKNNPKHDKAYELLATLVANRPQDEKVTQAARTWLNSHRTHTNAYVLLRRLIIHSHGAADWMSAGEAWLTTKGAKGKSEVLGALLSAGGLASKYLDKLLERLERAHSRERKTIHFVLSQGLANNVVTALDHLRGEDYVEHKAVLAKLLAKGLSHYRNRAEEFVERLSSAPADCQGLLLSGCIRSDLYGAILDCVVEAWLTANHGREGYDEVLRALKESPARCQELLERNNLAPAVVADLEAFVPTPTYPGGSKRQRYIARRRDRKKPPPSPDSDQH